MLTLTLALVPACLPLAAQGTHHVSAPPTPPSHVGTVVVGGPVHGTWTAGGSPYLLLEDTLVDSLVVEAGVEVRAAPGVELRVTGSITTLGTAAEPVLFTSRTPGETWFGVRLFFASGTSSFTHTRFEHGTFAGLTVQTSLVAPITHCEFVSNHVGVFVTTAVGDVVLRDCLIEDNLLLQPNSPSGAGVSVNMNGTFTMERCTVRGNQAIASPCGYASGGGISVLQAAEVFLTDLLVEDNVCRAATGLAPLCSACSPEAAGGGIALGCPFGYTICSPPPTFDATLTRCIIRNNSALCAQDAHGDCLTLDLHALGGGIAYGCRNQTLTLRNVVLSGNAVWSDGELQTADGGAVFFNGKTLNATNCTVARNYAVEGQSVPGVSRVLSPGIQLASTRGTSELRNSVLYENFTCWMDTPPTVGIPICPGAIQATWPIQGPGAITVSYSDVQFGATGTGNFDLPPLFAGTGTTYADLSIVPGSPLVDAGNPAPIYNDSSFPPSLGTTRNDIGSNGGPLAGGWILTGN